MNDWHENAPVAHFTNTLKSSVQHVKQTLLNTDCKIYRGKYARHTAVVDDVDVSLVDGQLLVLVQLKIRRKSHPGFVDDKKYQRWQNHWYIWGVEVK